MPTIKIYEDERWPDFVITTDGGMYHTIAEVSEQFLQEYRQAAAAYEKVQAELARLSGREWD